MVPSNRYRNLTDHNPVCLKYGNSIFTPNLPLRPSAPQDFYFRQQYVVLKC